FGLASASGCDACNPFVPRKKPCTSRVAGHAAGRASTVRARSSSRGPRRLNQGGREPAGSGSSPSGEALTGTLLQARTRQQMPGGGEAGHIDSDPGEKHGELYAITQARPLGESPGDGEQLGARIEPDREPALADASGDVASDGAATTADIKDALSSGDVEQGEIGLARRDFVFRRGATLESGGEITRAVGVRYRGITPHTLVSVLAHALV